jgi:hypothetical protein
MRYESRSEISYRGRQAGLLNTLKLWFRIFECGHLAAWDRRQADRRKRAQPPQSLETNIKKRADGVNIFFIFDDIHGRSEESVLPEKNSFQVPIPPTGTDRLKWDHGGRQYIDESQVKERTRSRYSGRHC